LFATAARAASDHQQEDTAAQAAASDIPSSAQLAIELGLARVRSMTWPLSWPQAASISSPRVRRHHRQDLAVEQDGLEIPDVRVVGRS
jgi:hypothetical protein